MSEVLACGFAQVVEGVPTVQVYDPANGSREEVAMFGALGVTALPYAPEMDGDQDASGQWAEALVDYDVAGFKGVTHGYRDRRNADIVGALKPGDTAIHTTGPDKKAQLQLKQSGMAALMCKDSKAKDMALLFDGQGDSVSLTAFGHHITLSRDGITLGEKGGSSGITITKDYVHIRGSVILGGSKPNPAMTLVAGPVIPNAPYIIPSVAGLGSPAPTTLLGVPGVSIGL